MKIDAQTKIAELEQRIVALEEALKKTTVRQTVQTETVFSSRGGIFGAEWNKMWASFDRVMKHAFDR